MVNFPIQKSVKWLKPLPLWAQQSSTGIRVREGQLETEPTILRFASDTFMDDLMEVLAKAPARLADWVALPETWRRPMPAPRPLPAAAPETAIEHLFNRTKRLTLERSAKGVKKTVAPSDSIPPARSEDTSDLPFRLYQAGHQRYYLVCASLLSNEPGYPDCEPDLSRNERATFVVRRLVPSSDQDIGQPFDKWKAAADEYAFVETAGGQKWIKIAAHSDAATRHLVAGEEQLPMFRVAYRDLCGGTRRLHSGLIPVGKRETWLGAPAGTALAVQSSSAGADGGTDGIALIQAIFQNDVIEPWKALLEQARDAEQNAKRMAPSYFTDPESELSVEERAALNAQKEAERNRLHRNLRDRIQTASWYILLDFANFLHDHLRPVWEVISGEAPEESLENLPLAADLLVMLENVRISWSLKYVLAPSPYTSYSPSDVKMNLRQALAAVRDHTEGLEAVDTEFVRYTEDGDQTAVDEKWPDFLFPLADPDPVYGAPLTSVDIDMLADQVLTFVAPSREAAATTGARTLVGQREAWFVVRCVYERPECGPLFPALVSAPTRPFQMAPFFDPYAPSRPVRIPMPLDISPAGLRKYQKNAAFVMSDMLCGQIKRIRKLTLGDLVLSVLPWPFHKDLPDPGETGPCTDPSGSIGMICSLSIPIVTLCALILLIIIVALFDMFFKWIPYLFMCLPIPGLKGKR